MSIREKLFGREEPVRPSAVDPNAANVSTSELDGALTRIGRALDQPAPEGDVLVISGANSQPFPVATRTVGEARETLAYIMNIGPNATPLVNGSVVPPDYILQQDDTLEFTREGGEKGASEHLCRHSRHNCSA